MNLITNEQIEIEESRRRCSRSYYEFVKESVQVMEPETNWKFNWHIKIMCDVIQEEVLRIMRKEPKGHDLIFCVPPGSMKTTVFSINLIAWAWIHAPHFRLATKSYNDRLAIKHCLQSRDVILSEWYQARWGSLYSLKGDQNLKTHYENDKGGMRLASPNTGYHLDMVLGDDLLNPRKMMSEVEVENVNEFWLNTLASRFRDILIGSRVVAQQRLGERDTIAEIIRRGLNYKQYIIPAEFSGDIKPKALGEYYTDGLMWPERFSREWLDDMKKSLMATDYSSQYMQSPYPDDGGMIKKAWLSDNIVTKAEVPEDSVRYFYTDTSYGKNSKGDPSAIGCWSIHNGNIYIWRVHAAILDFNEFLLEYDVFVNENNGDWRSAHYFEDKASGPTIIQYLRENSKKYRVLPDKLPHAESKVMRVHAALPTLASGKVRLVKGDWNDHFIKECMAFPNGYHDDQVDVLSAIVRLSDLTVYEDKGDEYGEEDKF